MLFLWDTTSCLTLECDLEGGLVTYFAIRALCLWDTTACLTLECGLEGFVTCFSISTMCLWNTTAWLTLECGLEGFVTCFSISTMCLWNTTACLTLECGLEGFVTCFSISTMCLWNTTAWLTLECDLEVVWWHILPSVRCLCEIPQHDWPWSVTLRWFWWHILPSWRWLLAVAVSEYMAELVGWTALHPGRLIWLGTFLKVPPRQKPPLTSLLQDNWDEILPLIYLHSTLSLSFPPQQNHQPNLVTLCLQRFNAETPKIARHVHVQWILTFKILLTARFPSKNCQVLGINISVFLVTHKITRGVRLNYIAHA